VDALKLANVETYEYIMLDKTPLSPLGEEMECNHYLLMNPEYGDLCENSLLFAIEPRDSILIRLEHKISLHSEEAILGSEEAVLTSMNTMPCAYNDSHADYYKQCRHPKVTEVYLRALMSGGYGCHMIEYYYVPTLIALKDTDIVCANLAVVAAVSPGSSYARAINSATTVSFNAVLESTLSENLMAIRFDPTLPVPASMTYMYTSFLTATTQSIDSVQVSAPSFGANKSNTNTPKDGVVCFSPDALP